ncbi:efflux RND transporter permease subunit [Inquilinus limosus]|uniref:efflux RND transporter permease subunit n=1 Tax=Inquilinus limosus TaxID=171674 RepID=UPI000420F355|nr:efflux RND transporter permease subunit [Inquilinus limosus]
MILSELCIRRPVMTTLLTAAMVLAGAFAYNQLPVAALPNTDFPVINVSASLPGASPDTMASSVATPLEKQFETIAGIQTISATSTQGQTSITLEFDLSRNIDAAAADVQSAITAVQRQLPTEMTTPPSYRKVNPADAPILLLAISSPTLPLSTLDAYAEQVISPSLSTLSGVAQVQIYGSQKYAVRIQVDPDALSHRGISIDDIRSAVAKANDNSPVGTLQGPQQQLILQANTQLYDAKAFASLIVASPNGMPVRLGDVAKVIDSVENDQVASWYGDTRSIILAVQRQPDANTVAIVDAVKDLLPKFQADLPPSVSLHVLNDRSTSIRQAIEDVQFTLGLTIALVVMVIFLFLRRLSATIIPTVTVPISLVATVAGMYLCGFSIDNISLLGLTLSVGLVVDDAIVMLENIVRYIEKGMKPFEAALKGAREIGFTILSITLSLVAVFIPVLLMGGVVGRIFNEFAVVVTMAIAASAFVSLTLTPMMCSRFLRGHDEEKPEGRIGRTLEAGFDAVLGLYSRTLAWCLRHRAAMLLVFFGTIAGTWLLFTTIPKGFFPTEDIGQLQVTTQARQDISFDAMVALQSQVRDVFLHSPFVDSVGSSVGAVGYGGTLNTGRLFVQLKPKDQRPPLDTVIPTLRRQLAGISGIDTYMVPVQNLRIGGRSSSAQYQFVMQGLDQKQLYDWAGRMTTEMRRSPVLQDVSSDLQLNALQATLTIDRDKAAQLGIANEDLRATLYGGFGTQQISTIYTAADSYEVILEVDPSTPWGADSLDKIYVRSSNGSLVPLSAFATVTRTAGPLSVNQQGQLPSVTISFNLAANRSLGDATAEIDRIKAEIGLPVTITTGYAGTAQVFQDSLANQGLLLLGAVLTIYIVLGILYESFTHPLVILSGLPSAAIGALGTLMLFRTDLSVIAIIGVLMLIGIVKKNAIMMIDFALGAQRNDGLAPRDAIYRACTLRFRPIMMTTMAALMGALPIAVGQGASAELRQPLGLAVVGGLLVSQLLTLYITPVLYLYVEDLTRGALALGRRFRRAPDVGSATGHAPAE